MEELNKNQIILLTLLISFVTSIATGIMTTSLLQEAPVEITRNINRIVEKTVETVTTPITQTSVQKETKTVIVKEEDLLVDSISKNVKSIVRIKEKNPFTEEVSFYGIGLVVSKDGLIATDRKFVTTTHVYTATLNDNTSVLLVPQAVDKQTNFIIFKAILGEKSVVVFTPATISDIEPKLGQTLISVGGDSSNAVAVGRVSSLNFKDMTSGSTTVKTLNSIDTDISPKDLVVGSPIFNLSGDIVGVKLSNDGLRSFTPISVFKRELSSITETVKVESKSR